MKVTTISLYKNRDVFTEYLINSGVSVDQIYILKTPRHKFQSKWEVVVNEVIAVIKLLLNYRRIRNRKIYCSGAQLATLFVGKLIGCDIYIYNFYLHAYQKKWITKRVLRILLNNKNVTLIVQSPEEKMFYRTLSSKIRLSFIPYCSDIKPNLHKENKQPFIFTGGYSNRDYDIIANLASRFPKLHFVVVASRLNKNIDKLRGGNITLYRDIPSYEFNSLLADASIVIIPLKEEVGSSGQMLCLSAMRNSKPIIYTNTSSINYYFSETSGFPYQIGDITSLEKVLLFCLENPEICQEYARNAYVESLKYTSLERCKRIKTIMAV